MGMQRYLMQHENQPAYPGLQQHFFDVLLDGEAGSSQPHGQHYATHDATPIPGIPVRPPLAQPQPGQVITHYEVYSPKVGCCECEGMKSSGMVAVILLFIFLPPFCFIPCLMNECFEQQQRPVYGYPAGSSSQPQQGQGQQMQQYPETHIPVAELVQGHPVQYPKATQPPTQPAIQKNVNADVV